MLFIGFVCLGFLGILVIISLVLIEEEVGWEGFSELLKILLWVFNFRRWFVWYRLRFRFIFGV